MVGGDALQLEGLLYQARPTPGDVAILHIHGRGGNFYTGPTRTVPRQHPDLGVVHLAINLRAHDLAYTVAGDLDPNDQVTYGAGGAMWERLSESVADVAAAVAFLKERGHSRVFAVAHSAGAITLAEYAAVHHGLSGRILLSPLTDARAGLLR